VKRPPIPGEKITLTQRLEGTTMTYEVRMTVYAIVEVGSKQEAKDVAMDSLRENPLIEEVQVTQTTEA
jgi:hypothetical protein